MSWLMLLAPPPICPMPALRCTNTVEVGVEELAEQQREQADDDVGDRRGEVGAQLLVGDGEDVPHADHCTPPRAASPAGAGVRFGGGRRRRRAFLGRHLQEDLLQAHAHRPQLQQPPAARDDGAGDVAADVGAALALHFEAVDAAAMIRRPRRGSRRESPAARLRPRRPARRPARTASRPPAAARSGCPACRRRPRGPC